MVLGDYFDEMADELEETVTKLDDALVLADALPPEIKDNKKFQKFLKKVETATQELYAFLEYEECEGEECELEDGEDAD